MPLSTLAICRILKKPLNDDGLVVDDICPVLFPSRIARGLFPTPSELASVTLEEGKEVYTWKPWSSVNLPLPGITFDNEVRAGGTCPKREFDLLMGEVKEEDDTEKVVVRRVCTIALICSRFVVKGL